MVSYDILEHLKSFNFDIFYFWCSIWIYEKTIKIDTYCNTILK